MDVIGFFISLFSLSVFVILLLFITELFLFPKVESCIYTDSSESISEGEVLFSIVVCMHHQRSSYKIFVGVIDHGSICVLTQYGRLLLVGEGIRIVSYSGEEMRVEGRIDQVTFQ